MGPMLSVSELEKTYEVRKTAFSNKKTTIRVVDRITFDLHKGKTLGIVGESGSGKSTLARCLMLLEKPDSGVIKFFDQDLLKLKEESLKSLRKDIQIIFQDPYSSLNPRKKIVNTLSEPLLFHQIANRQNVNEKAVEILHNVGLDEDSLDKYPHEMSGGQRQRVAIGRALASEPSLLIADEPVSSLDVSIQAQIINLFVDIKNEFKISMIFISHDLNIVRFISDDILVLYKGSIVEMGTRDEIFLHPVHPYTQMLIKASQGEFCTVQEKTDGAITDNGCKYYRRCELADHFCEAKAPNLQGAQEHSVACFKAIRHLI
ncbi:MAG TPA: ATP-binding cassette domain-containing protein [Syntrophorhabdus sp.]|nr:ATP-binding cassette domain-containing protein [Syntrophorhabdus sp.]